MENTLLHYYMSNRIKTFKNSIIFWHDPNSYYKPL